MDQARIVSDGVSRRETPEGATPKWLALGVIAVLIGLVLRAAWMTDDAYITLRTVDLLVHGEGLRWNLDERVQGYTHPLWMFLLSIPYFLTREAYLTTILTGVGTTLVACLAMQRNARSAGHAIGAIGLLMLSRSFIEFSTSGLENPLTHLLVAHFVWVYAVRQDGIRTVALAASLVALNRSDALIVALPALLHALWAEVRAVGAKQAAREAAIGFSPYAAWLAFSLFYYGFLVPNTAFAKLNTGIPFAEVARQGLTYVLNALAWDPPLLIVTLLGVGLAAAQGGGRPRLLAVGVLLYIGFVIQIGGDFMIGRFLTLPFFLAVCLIAISELPLEDPARLALFVLPMVALFFHPSATEKYPVGDFHHSGVADERYYYRDGTALMFFTRQRGLPSHFWASEGREAGTRPERVVAHENIGFFGYFATPRVHVVDINALTEPLLARLPAYHNPDWRVGHYLRKVPEGYVETIKTGQCQMPDPGLCAYYGKLKEIISGDLFSLSRLGTIVAMNFGAYDHLIDRDRYQYPGIIETDLDAMSVPIPERAPWDSPGSRICTADGVRIALGKRQKAERIALSLDGNDQYDILFYAGNTLLGSVTAFSMNRGMMHSRTFDLPKRAYTEGYDRIWVRPASGDNKYAVGYLRLIP